MLVLMFVCPSRCREEKVLQDTAKPHCPSGCKVLESECEERTRRRQSKCVCFELPMFYAPHECLVRRIVYRTHAYKTNRSESERKFCESNGKLRLSNERPLCRHGMLGRPLTENMDIHRLLLSAELARPLLSHNSNAGSSWTLPSTSTMDVPTRYRTSRSIKLLARFFGLCTIRTTPVQSWEV